MCEYQNGLMMPTAGGNLTFQPSDGILVPLTRIGFRALFHAGKMVIIHVSFGHTVFLGRDVRPKGRSQDTNAFYFNGMFFEKMEILAFTADVLDPFHLLQNRVLNLVLFLL